MSDSVSKVEYRPVSPEDASVTNVVHATPLTSSDRQNTKSRDTKSWYATAGWLATTARDTYQPPLAVLTVTGASVHVVPSASVARMYFTRRVVSE